MRGMPSGALSAVGASDFGCTGYVPCHHNVLCKKSVDCFVDWVHFGSFDSHNSGLFNTYSGFGIILNSGLVQIFIDHSDTLDSLDGIFVFDGNMKEQSNIHIIYIYR